MKNTEETITILKHQVDMVEAAIVNDSIFYALIEIAVLQRLLTDLKEVIK